MSELETAVGLLTKANGDGKQGGKFHVGPPDPFGKRLITATRDGKSYPDRLDPYSDPQRERFAGAVWKNLYSDTERLAMWNGEADESGQAIAHIKLAVLKAVMATDERLQAEEQKPLAYRRVSCAELDAATYDLEYLIDGALVAGQPCIVAGGKKCLKTSLLIDLGISLAVGGCFLGKLKASRACRVGIMTGESGLATIQETARRIAYAAGHNLADIGGLVFSEDLPQFGSIAHDDALRQFITNDELEVLAVDPAYLCLPDVDHANLFSVGEKLRGVSRVCQETGALLLLAHHTRKTKTDPFSPPELEDIAWAGFQEFARQWLLVGRREAYEPGTGQHRLWLSAGGSAGHSALWAVDIDEGTRDSLGGRYWHVDVMQAGEARQDVEDRKEANRVAAREEQLESDKRKVCNTLAKFPKGESKSIVRDSSGRYSTKFNVALAALLEEGVIVPCEIIKGRRKTPIEGYRLKDETPNE